MLYDFRVLLFFLYSFNNIEFAFCVWWWVPFGFSLAFSKHGRRHQRRLTEKEKKQVLHLVELLLFATEERKEVHSAKIDWCENIHSSELREMKRRWASFLLKGWCPFWFRCRRLRVYTRLEKHKLNWNAIDFLCTYNNNKKRTLFQIKNPLLTPLFYPPICDGELHRFFFLFSILCRNLTSRRSGVHLKKRTRLRINKLHTLFICFAFFFSPPIFHLFQYWISLFFFSLHAHACSVDL